jgi:hypothetical protein
LRVILFKYCTLSTLRFLDARERSRSRRWKVSPGDLGHFKASYTTIITNHLS